MHKKTISTQSLVIFFVVGVVLGAFVTIRPSSAQEEIKILYVSENVEDWRDDSFQTALDLDPIFVLDHKTPNLINFSSYLDGLALLADYEVVCLLDIVLTPANQSLLKEYVNMGGVLIILCGNDLTVNHDIFITMEIIESFDLGNVTKNSEDALSAGIDPSSPLEANIDWNSCPAIENYTSFGDTLGSSFSGNSLIIKSPRDDSEVTTLDPLVFKKELGTGRIGVISYWLEGQSNLQFIL